MEFIENAYPINGTIIIIGPRFSGKTTICNIIQKFNFDAKIFDGIVPSLEEICRRNRLIVITCTNLYDLSPCLRTNASHVIFPCGISTNWCDIKMDLTGIPNNYHILIDLIPRPYQQQPQPCPTKLINQDGNVIHEFNGMPSRDEIKSVLKL